MMTKRVIAAQLLLLSALPPTLLAQQSAGAEQAAAIARDSTGGRVLSVEPAANAKKPSYRVKVLLQDGRVRVLRIDPGKR